MTEYNPDPIHADLRVPDRRYLDKDLATQCLHAGERWERGAAWTSSTPIYNSTTYFYDTADDLDDVVYYRKPGYVYSRYGSPTHTALERAISTLEGADATLSCSSGMAASHLSLLAAGAGQEQLLLCSSDVYGSVYTMVENIFPNLGGRSLLMDFSDLNRLEEVIKRERPSVVYFEVVTNPMTKVVDAPAVIDLAHRYGARVVVDNTFTTPYLLKPIELGADLVSQSVTKFLSGHGDVLAGAVSCGRQDFDRLFDLAIQVGCTLGPNEAWLALRGIKTFPLRFERQCANALEVARFLEGHALIERVRYVGLPSHPQHETAKRIFCPHATTRDGAGMYGAMLNFDLADCDKDKAFRFMDALQMILAATSLGDVYSLIVNPARTTHHWLGEERLEAIGIRPGTFRMSVGIEGVADIIADLDQALKACQ